VSSPVFFHLYLWSSVSPLHLFNSVSFPLSLSNISFSFLLLFFPLLNMLCFRPFPILLSSFCHLLLNRLKKYFYKKFLRLCVPCSVFCIYQLYTVNEVIHKLISGV
jgi:hypothetical protein